MPTRVLITQQSRLQFNSDWGIAASPPPARITRGPQQRITGMVHVVRQAAESGQRLDLAAPITGLVGGQLAPVIGP
jgi:hypothetical protein